MSNIQEQVKNRILELTSSGAVPFDFSKLKELTRVAPKKEEVPSSAEVKAE